MDPLYFVNLDIDPNPHLSKKLDPDPVQQSQNSGALKAHDRGVEDQIGVLEGLRPVVTDSHHSDKEQDTD